MSPARPPKSPLDHLTIRFGSNFEASAGGKVAVIILGLVAILWVLPPILAQFWT